MPRVHEPLYDKDGNCIGHATRWIEYKACSSCGNPRATQLCDYKLANGKTCDRPLCLRCAVMQKPVWGQKDRVDYCPAHARTPLTHPGDKG